MYTEEYEHKGYPIKNFVIRLILVIIFVLLLIWLLPKILSPIVKSDGKTNSNCNGASTCDLSGLNALTSQIFADNLERMKDAAISYYTADRLPKNVGESSTMTLSDMIGKKLITPLIDKNNKAVDVEKSYVKITKENNEYVLKVNIKDSEKEDYILVHLGCYSYCESYLCQKQTTTTTTGTKTSTPTPVTPAPGPSPQPSKIICEERNGKYYDANGNRVSELNYIISCQAPKCKVVNGYYFDKNGKNVSKSTYLSSCSSTPGTYKCEYRDGKYYDKNGKVVTEVNYIISCQAPKCQIVNGFYFGKNGDNVSKSEYEAQCSAPTTHTCEYYGGKYYDKNGNVVSEVNYIISCQAPKCQIVNGYYFGKNGNNVNKATYEAECSTPTTHTCEYYGGKYYDKNGNVVSEVNYIISCQAPKCQVVNGYYFGKNGNNVTKEQYQKECSTPVEYLYEYKKVTAAVLSSWTKWGDWEKTDCATKEQNCDENSASCLYKLQRYDRKEKIGTYQKTYAKQREVIKKIGEYTQKSCSKYKYIKINNTIYATTTTTTYTTVDTITHTTTSTQGGWVYQGRGTYSNPPSDTATTHYVFAGADYSDCGETCTSLPKYYYDIYKWQPGTTQVTDTLTPGTPTSTTTTETTETTTTTYQAQCGEIKEQVIPIYGTVTVTEKAARTEPLYGTVCYQSTKSRSVLTPEKVEYKWSTYNDTSLLNAGWVYTGNKKQK